MNLHVVKKTKQKKFEIQALENFSKSHFICSAFVSLSRALPSCTRSFLGWPCYHVTGQTGRQIFMKFCINVCLFHVMIPIVFYYDQTKAKRMAFSKPVVMATDLGSQVLIQLKIPWNCCLIVLNMCAKFQNFWWT